MREGIFSCPDIYPILCATQVAAIPYDIVFPRANSRFVSLIHRFCSKMTSYFTVFCLEIVLVDWHE